MKGKDLLDKINSIDNDLIKEASNINKRRKVYNKWYVIAASLCVVILGTALFNNYGMGKHFEYEKEIVANEEIVSNEENTSNEEIKNSLVYIPKIELPKESNALFDMIGFVIYKGNIYTQAESFIGESAEKVDSLVGKRLGYAKGNIDEWSNQEAYAEEFAGSAIGDVYTVNGYDEDFCVCIRGSYKEDGKGEVEYIEFFENLNGIGLNTGKDLFGNRLKLEGNYDYLKYITHDNWNNDGWFNYNYLDLKDTTQVDIDEFIKELYNGEFVNMENSNIYDNPSHHIFVYMKDKTRIELRLFEGGYVGYQSLGWYFVKMPGDIFEKIYAATR